jgi:hypothetical protein
MKRHYFVTTDLEDLEQVETELESAGIGTPHIHVLTNDAAGAATHRLHPVNDFMKRDVFRSAVMGASVGTMLVMFILIAVSVSGAAARLGWMPFVLLCGVLLGFSTWEGGLLGMQRPNHALQRFMGSIRKGRHVLLVDVEEQQEKALSCVVAHHPALRAARDGVPG